VKSILFGTLLFSLISFAADKKMKMNFSNEDISKVIESYAKSSDQNFIVDPSVRGKITIINAESVEMAEAYNQLSSALALNGYGISKQENSYVVRPARSIQRDLIEVTNEVPALKPERMVTWVMTVKNISAKNVLRDMRNLSSREGEMNLSSQSNQIVITDWTSNLNRISELFKQLDKPVDPKLHKFVEQNKKSE
jgi:type II secretory pathway component GspD/PulD (secretin)